MSSANRVKGQTEKVTGIVNSVSVAGYGPNSAEIVFSINVDGDNEAYAVYSNTEPAVFSAFVSILTTAYQNKIKIDVSYGPGPGQAPTPAIYQLDFPSATP